MSDHAFIVPLRSLVAGKSRLRDAGVEDADEILRELALATLRALRDAQVFVVTEDHTVSDFAKSNGVRSIRTTAQGLNASLAAAEVALPRHIQQLTIVHADLEDPSELAHYRPGLGVTIVTDYLATGTNVLSVPRGRGFAFAFGVNSKDRHVAEASRLGLESTVLQTGPWIFDVDTVEDVQRWRQNKTGGPKAPSSSSSYEV
jgi:2-phospho-L-lactate guanylyltransferase